MKVYIKLRIDLAKWIRIGPVWPRSKNPNSLVRVPSLFVEEEGEVEEGAAEVGLELDGAFEPVLGRVVVAVVHAQHAKVEVHPIVVRQAILHLKRIYLSTRLYSVFHPVIC